LNISDLAKHRITLPPKALMANSEMKVLTNTGFSLSNMPNRELRPGGSSIMGNDPTAL
jgi:hypothetical protein